jgi:hypothetical protein
MVAPTLDDLRDSTLDYVNHDWRNALLSIGLLRSPGATASFAIRADGVSRLEITRVPTSSGVVREVRLAEQSGGALRVEIDLRDEARVVFEAASFHVDQIGG